jgi:hypothetical protein
MEIDQDNHYPTINSNLHLDSVLTVKKYLGSYHSYSVVALMMLDFENNGLTIDLCFNNNIELNNAADHLLGVWNKCESNKVVIRKYKINNIDNTITNNINIDNIDIDNIELNKIENNEIYKNQTKIYVDIEKINYNIKYMLYRNNDTVPRILNLKLV